jgi:pseudouridine-5'-monophosphatase
LPLSPAALVHERDRLLIELVARAPAIAGAEAFTRALAGAACRWPSPPAPRRRSTRSRRPPSRAGWRSSAAAVCGDDPRVARPKPAPDIFLAAARDLGAPPASCLVFEDSPFGVEAARAAGMQVIALPDRRWTRARYAHADAVLSGFGDLTPDSLGF